MDLNNISSTIKDTSRSIYIQLLAGKTKSEQLINDISELEAAIGSLKSALDIGYTTTSDLKGLAAREAQQ
jgi:hypothetical protein